MRDCLDRLRTVLPEEQLEAHCADGSNGDANESWSAGETDDPLGSRSKMTIIGLLSSASRHIKVPF